MAQTENGFVTRIDTLEDVQKSYAINPRKSLPADVKIYDSMTSFTAAGGPSAYGIGLVFIGEVQYWCDGSTLTPIVSTTRQMVAVVLGNSITAAMATSGTQWTYKAEHILANAMAGNPLIWPEITASTRADKYGCYGYSGQTINTINGDIPDQLFTPLDNAGVAPDVFLCLATVENDVGNGATSYENIVTGINNTITMIKNRYSGAIIVIGTCRPSYTVNTPAIKQLWLDVNSYILSLDDGVTIFTYEPGADYADQNNVGSPLKTTVRGTIASGVLTVNSVVDAPIPLGIGQYVNSSSYYISAMTTGTGGVGTYTITGGIPDNGTESNITIYPYTDTSVHPKERATQLNAKRLADCLKRILGTARNKSKTVANNHALLGTGGTVTGGSATGTAPNNVTVTGNANATCLAEAMQPGLRLTFSNITSSSGTLALLSSVAFIDTDTGTILPTGVDAFRVKSKIRIVSGGEYLRNLGTRYRVTDNGVAGTATDWMSQPSSAMDAAFINGEIYEMCSPTFRSGGVGTLITRLRGDFVAIAAARAPVGAEIVLEIIGFEFELPDGNSGLLTLNGSTEVVVSAGALVTANSKINLEIKTVTGTPAGAPYVSSKTVGTSFGVKAAAGDTSVVRWEIVNK